MKLAAASRSRNSASVAHRFAGAVERLSRNREFPRRLRDVGAARRQHRELRKLQLGRAAEVRRRHRRRTAARARARADWPPAATCARGRKASAKGSSWRGAFALFAYIYPPDAGREQRAAPARGAAAGRERERRASSHRGPRIAAKRDAAAHSHAVGDVQSGEQQVVERGAARRGTRAARLRGTAARASRAARAPSLVRQSASVPAPAALGEAAPSATTPPPFHHARLRRRRRAYRGRRRRARAPTRRRTSSAAATAAAAAGGELEPTGRRRLVPGERSTPRPEPAASASSDRLVGRALDEAAWQPCRRASRRRPRRRPANVERHCRAFERRRPPRQPLELGRRRRRTAFAAASAAGESRSASAPPRTRRRARRLLELEPTDPAERRDTATRMKRRARGMRPRYAPRVAEGLRASRASPSARERARRARIVFRRIGQPPNAGSGASAARRSGRRGVEVHGAPGGSPPSGRRGAGRARASRRCSAAEGAIQTRIPGAFSSAPARDQRARAVAAVTTPICRRRAPVAESARGDVASAPPHESTAVPSRRERSTRRGRGR